MKRKINPEHHKIGWRKITSILFIGIGASLVLSTGIGITGSAVLTSGSIQPLAAISGIVLVILGLTFPLTT